MAQSKYGVFISLCLLLVLTSGFFLASRVVYDKLHRAVVAAITTPTVEVAPSTPTHPPATPTPKSGVHPHPVHSPTATPSPSSIQVLVGSSADLTSAATTFPGGTSRFYCMANMPNVPGDAQLTFTFQQLPTASQLFQYPTPASAYSSALKYSFLDGPLSAGQYRCQLTVNSQLAGQASFTVQ